MDFAYAFIIENGGLDTEADYKYQAQQGTCNLKKEKRHVATIDDYEDVPPNDEKSLEKARRAASLQYELVLSRAKALQRL